MDLGLGSLFGGIASSIGNVISTRSTNKTNQKIAADTNAANAAINQSQIDYNWQMWHAQNDYNNPSAQRQRLVDANLNPIYYGLDGNSAAAGNAFTPIAAEQASPAIPNNFDGLSRIASDIAGIKKSNSDSDLSSEKAETERQLRSGTVDILGTQINLNKQLYDFNDANNKKLLEKATEEITAIRQSVDESFYKCALIRSQTDYQNFKKNLDFALYRLEQDYKRGIIDYNTKSLAIQWFNASTQRFDVTSQAHDRANTQSSRIALNWSLSKYNNYNASAVFDSNIRANRSFKLDQLNRAATYYNAVVDKWYMGKFLPFGNKPANVFHKYVNSLTGGSGINYNPPD